MNANKSKPRNTPDERSAQETASAEPVESADAMRAENSDPPVDESLESQLAAAQSQRDANYDRFLRAQADLENYRKRAQKEAQDVRQYAALQIVRELLPGLDNLGRAIEAARKTHNVDELIQGVEIVARQFEDILTRCGVVPICAEGEPFDPNLHEAIQQVSSAVHPPMTVMGEVERGYMLHERVVRPSKVIVSGGPPQDTSQAQHPAP